MSIHSGTNSFNPFETEENYDHWSQAMVNSITGRRAEDHFLEKLPVIHPLEELAYAACELQM